MQHPGQRPVRPVRRRPLQLQRRPGGDPGQQRRRPDAVQPGQHRRRPHQGRRRRLPCARPIPTRSPTSASRRRTTTRAPAAPTSRTTRSAPRRPTSSTTRRPTARAWRTASPPATRSSAARSSSATACRTARPTSPATSRTMPRAPIRRHLLRRRDARPASACSASRWPRRACQTIPHGWRRRHQRRQSAATEARSSTSPAPTARRTRTAPSRPSTTSPTPGQFAADYKAKFNTDPGCVQRCRRYACTQVFLQALKAVGAGVTRPRGPPRGGPRLRRRPGATSTTPCSATLASTPTATRRQHIDLVLQVRPDHARTGRSSSSATSRLTRSGSVTRDGRGPSGPRPSDRAPAVASRMRRP